jgi:hypothetical protein
MRSLRPALLCTLLFVASPLARAEETPAPYLKLLGNCKDLDNSFKCARAIEKSQSRGKLRRYFDRQDNAVNIRTASRIVTLKDFAGDSEESSHYYSYQTFLPKLQLHVLHVQFYEGSGFYIVHHKSGVSAPIDGFPMPSPDAKRFVAISSAGDAGYSRNSVEIWNVEDGRAMRAEYRYEPAAARWSPKKATWSSPKSVNVEGECGAELGGAKDCGAVAATFQDGGWRLKWALKRPE